MASTKTVLGLGLLAKNETSYSGSTTFSTATDGIQVADVPIPFEVSYAYDGSRPMPQSTAGTQRRNTPTGRSTKATIKIEAKGAYTGYSASVTPPYVHPFILAAGFSGSMQGGTWVYKPTDVNSTPSSLALGVYSRGEYRNVRGAYCNLQVDAPNAGAPIWSFPIEGLISIPSSSAAPTITYSASGTLPPLATNIQLSIGGYTTSHVRSFKFDLGREIHPQVDLNTTQGIGGFTPGRRKPKFSCVIEADSLETWNPYNAVQNADQDNITLTIGSASFNQYVLNFPQANIMSVKDGAENNTIATWELEFDCPCSGPATNDDIIITYQ